MAEMSFVCPVCSAWNLRDVHEHDSGVKDTSCDECNSDLSVDYSIEVCIESIDIIERREDYLDEDYDE